MALKILLADDSVTAQNLAKKILTDVGHEVVAVSNGAAAIKKLGTEKPDLLILDVYMPGYTGLEVCEKVKTSTETAATPVLLTVAPMEPYNPIDGKRVHADGVILKPFEARDLVPAVERLQERAVAARKPAAEDRSLSWKSQRKPEAQVEPQADEIQAHADGEIESTNENRPAPLPELPQELAVAPAFLEQFGEEFNSAPQALAPELAAIPAESALHANNAIAVETVEASAPAAAPHGFDLLAPSLPQPYEAKPELPSLAVEQVPEFPQLLEPETEAAAFAVEQAPAFPEISAPIPALDFAGLVSGNHTQTAALEIQAELEIDAANASLGELGFAAGLTGQSDAEPAVDLDLNSGVSSDATPAQEFAAPNHAETIEVASAQDPELMTDRTEMMQFATKFGSDVAEDIPVGIASPEQFAGDLDANLGVSFGASLEDAQEPVQYRQQLSEASSPEADLPEFSSSQAAHQAEQYESTIEFEPAESETHLSPAASAEFESSEVSVHNALRSESTLDEQVEQALEELPEVFSASESLPQHPLSPDESSELQSPPIPSRSLIDKALRAVERALYGESHAEAALTSTDASQSLQPDNAEPESEYSEIHTAHENSASFRAVDEYAVEEALIRILDRMRPQLVSEVVRELSHLRDS